jgi:hypothetical protein
MIRCVIAMFAGVIFAASVGLAAELAGHADLARIFSTEKFRLIYHVRGVSEQDWTAAGVRPDGRSITASMVDPGHSYSSEDDLVGDPRHQLLLAAKSSRHELLSYWQATQGGPMLRVLMLERDHGKPKLILYAVMNNDIPPERWTWGELKKHILQNKFDAIRP